MKYSIQFFLITLFLTAGFCEGAPRSHMNNISLNGVWEFEQTLDAFPPENFTRECRVPGLIHLAQPPISDYKTFFLRPDYVENTDSHNLMELDYIPKYSWYKKIIYISDSLAGQEAVLVLLKSQFVTQVYVNGLDMGGSISCYTPVSVPITHALKYGRENEIMIRVGDRAWLPAQAAGSIDKEKAHYLPGIWDDVNLVFTGKFFLQDILAVPSLKDSSVMIKLRIRSFYPSQIMYGGHPGKRHTKNGGIWGV